MRLIGVLWIATALSRECTEWCSSDSCAAHQISYAAGEVTIPEDCTELSLLDAPIGSAGMDALAEALKFNNAITRLNVFENDIGDAGAEALAHTLELNGAIQTVLIGGNNIGQAGAVKLAEALKTNTGVTLLSMGNNRFGDGGAAALAKGLQLNTAIRELHLENSQISDDGALALAEAIKLNQFLHDIDLESNTITEVGAAALIEALKLNTAVQKLRLLFNHVGDQALDQLDVALESAERRSTKRLQQELARYHALLPAEAMVEIGVHDPCDLLLIDSKQLTQLASGMKLLQRRLLQEAVLTMKELPVPPMKLDLPLDEWAAAWAVTGPALDRLTRLGGVRLPSDVMFLTSEELEQMTEGLKAVEAKRLRIVHAAAAEQASVVPGAASNLALEDWASRVMLSSRTLQVLVEIGVESPTQVTMLTSDELALVGESLNPLEVARLDVVIREQAKRRQVRDDL